MIAEMQAFIDELRADARFAPVVNDLQSAVDDIYAEGCEVVDAIFFLDALRWIAAQPRSIHDRLAAMQKIGELKGKVVIPNLRDFLGWN
jgi:hypothetical protein